MADTDDTEASPLLRDIPPLHQHELVYEKFSPNYKRFLVAVVSWCGIMPYFISGSFVPSVPQMAKDLSTTAENVTLAISLSLLATSFGGLVSATYSTFYGRRCIFLIGLPLSMIGSYGVGGARTIPELLFWRFWQCIGVSPGIGVGAAVIGDIYKLEERGTALGFYAAGTMLGPALAPPIGGFIAYYASWRHLQYSIGIACLSAFLLIYFVFPETSHPGTRGIDKRRQAGYVERNRLPVFINPLQSLNLLRSPNVFWVSLAGSFALITDYVLLIPMSYTIGKRYGIGNEALVGACFLPSGLGNFVGSPIAGRISDKLVVYYKEKRGSWHPEDRLRVTILGSLIFAPLSVLGCGLVTRYVDGLVGLILCLVLLFVNGVGVVIALSPLSAYLVDILHSRSAEVVAASRGFRLLTLVPVSAAIMPMINERGFLMTSFCAALSCWVGFAITVTTIRYGNEMRNWKDIGYSTAESN
ncbi:hypothetical protein Agabi119p4_3798 [Agaricus bisporus var. burnettii]|uniref:Major facilitator superfamily (MFS) profile domain-containing protein n=1 Tax=Agaricus bisporus var. burnettii TaxID=192524 RepID=A0A8H7KI11_AGABI|nr:hypothetical protein Agabi119p4_3798 [Agaricus bisporus var. burnettii]